MTKKRQPNSSIVSILEDDNLNIPDIDEDSSLDKLIWISAQTILKIL